MKKDLPIEALRLKLFRIESGWTQREFAKALGTKQSIADIERGRVRLSGQIIEGLVRKFNLNPSWLYGKDQQKYLKDSTIQRTPFVISENIEGKANITLVSGKAYAGYPDNLHDPKWFEGLPIFYLPIQKFQNTQLRCFQIEGDSMKGVIESGEFALCRFVEHLEDIHADRVYIVVTKDSLLCKRVSFDIKYNLFTLISVNPDYDILHLEAQELLEVWEVIGKISPDIKIYLPEHKQEEVMAELQQLRSAIAELKRRK